jgi:hypothetical protein
MTGRWFGNERSLDHVADLVGSADRANEDEA